MSISSAGLTIGCLMAAVAVALLPGIGRAASPAPTPPAPTPLTDPAALNPANLDPHDVKIEPVEYLGRKAIRLTTVPPDKDTAGFAQVRGTDFQDGTIDVDLAVKITTPPGVRMPGFTGLAFRMKPDGSSFEDVYLRPNNALADDQAMRN